MDYQKAEKEFLRYVKEFDTTKNGIAMKISHSIHTADLGGKLAKRLELGKEEQTLCKALGLLHDLGRFTEFKENGNYNIDSTFDHALAAINYLFKEGHSKDFGIPKKYESIFKKAIYYHNKLEIEEEHLNKQELFYTKLLRDIDKIDILRQEASSYEWKYDEPSKEVKKEFFENHLIDQKKVKNETDRLLLELAYVYGIYFKESYQLLKDTDNLELFMSVVVVTKEKEEEFEKIKENVRNFLEERMNTLC